MCTSLCIRTRYLSLNQPTAVWTVFLLTLSRFHILCIYHTCWLVYHLAKYFYGIFNALNHFVILVSVTPVKPMHPSLLTPKNNLLFISFLVTAIQLWASRCQKSLPIGTEIAMGNKSHWGIGKEKTSYLLPSDMWGLCRKTVACLPSFSHSCETQWNCLSCDVGQRATAALACKGSTLLLQHHALKTEVKFAFTRNKEISGIVKTGNCMTFHLPLPKFLLFTFLCFEYPRLISFWLY